MRKDSSKSFFKSVVIFVVCLLIFLNFPYVCETHAHSHEHDHDHAHHHDDHAHHDHHHRQGETPSFKYSREANVKYEEDVKFADNSHVSKDRFTLWAQAIGSTVLISAAPFLILFLVPLDNTKEREPLLKILLSFASGSLLGDAFLHLIPHAISPHSHDDSAEHSHGHSHSHDHGAEPHSHDMRVGFWVLFGIIAFLMVEKFVRLVKGGHSHSHSHGDTKHAVNQHKKKVNEKSEIDDSDNSKKKVKKGDKKEITESSQEGGDIKVAGYLNLAADFTHNFTDGLAIGASYLAGKNVGIVTTITILLHEVPHEIGDFAILIQSGCSKKKAMYLQLTTAVGALTGTLVSLLAEGIDSTATSWILPFTAGGFIYIATVSVIPELLSDTKFWQSVKEIIALLVGVYMMILIAYFE